MPIFVSQEPLLDVLIVDVEPDPSFFGSGPVTGFVVNDADGSVFFATSDGWLRKYSPEADTLEDVVLIGGSLRGIDLTSDGTQVFVAQGNFSTQDVQQPTDEITLHVVDVFGAMVTDISFGGIRGEAGTAYVAVTDAGSAIFSTDFAGSGQTPLRQVSTDDLSLTVRFFDPNPSTGLAWQRSFLSPSEDDRYILLQGANNSSAPMSVYDSQTDTFISSTNNFKTSGGGLFNSGIADISSAAGLLYNQTYGARVFDLEFDPVADLSQLNLQSLAFSDDGSSVYAKAGSSLLLLNTSNWSVEYSFDLADIYDLSGLTLLDIQGTSTNNAVVFTVQSSGSGDAGPSGLLSIDMVSLLSARVGTAASETLNGTMGPDTILAAGGDDIVYGGLGNDEIVGGSGNDKLSGDDGADSVFGGLGDDTLNGGAGADLLEGGAGTNVVSYILSPEAVSVDLVANTATGGEADGDVISGFHGVIGSEFDDTIVGGGTAGVFYGLGGEDTIVGGRGDDTIAGGAGADLLEGGVGTDTVSYADSPEAVSVDLDASTVAGGDAEGDVISDFRAVVGSEFDDTLIGGASAETFLGLDGDDTIAGGGSDLVDAGAGNDTVFIFSSSAASNPVLNGGEGGRDRLLIEYDTSVADLTVVAIDGFELLEISSSTSNPLELRLSAEAAGDFYNFKASASVLWDLVIEIEMLTVAELDLSDATVTGFAGARDGFIITGDDTSESILGSSVNDTILAAAGSDHIYGSVGDDFLDAGGSNDRLFGGLGDDTLSGGIGTDNFWGGLGADTFMLSDDNTRDLLRDFEFGLDVIDVSALGVTDFDQLNIVNQPNRSGRTVWVNISGPDVESEVGVRFGDGTALDASAFFAADFIFADEPPPPVIVQDTVGFDDLRGVPGAEVFVMTNDETADIIRNFEVGVDVIDVSALGVVSFNQLSIENQLRRDGSVNWIRVSDQTGVQEFKLRFSESTPLDATELPADSFIFAVEPPPPTLVQDGIGFDDLRGVPGPEIFVMLDDNVRDLIRGFDLGVDRIDVSDWGMSSFDELTITNQLRRDGSVNWVRIADGSGDEVAVRFSDGAVLDASSLTATDFLFA